MGFGLPSRRQLLGGSLASIATIFGGTIFTGFNGRRWQINSNDRSSITEGTTVALEPIVDGFQQPLALEMPIEDHAYIADKIGKIYVLPADLSEKKILLDLSGSVVLEHGEQGLLGLAFHPDFESNRRFYVRYSSARRTGTPEGYSHTGVLSEFETTNDYRSVKDDSERTILEIPEPGQIHNAGAIEFGPDGYLYVTLGDGGGDGHDGNGPLNRGPNNHAGDWYLTNVGGNGQDTTENLLGSVLRIKINDRTQSDPYSIPDTNPLVGERGLGEHYAWGFRNPYSLSFHEEDLYVGDVGTKLYEEVNLVEKGGNYGWNVKEGSSCHNNFPPLRAPSAFGLDVRKLPTCPNATPNGQELKDPVIAYPQSVGTAIIGGQVYRGSEIPTLDAKYVFGDLIGRLFAAQPATDEDFWTIEETFVTAPGRSEASKQMNRALLSIEAGRDGELFALTVGESGAIHRIMPSKSRN